MADDRIRCFLLEPTEAIRRSLRRFVYSSEAKCSNPGGYHDAMVRIEDASSPALDRMRERDWPHDDDRWPKACSCGYIFQEFDQWQVFDERFWRRTDNGEILSLRDAPAGAIWNAHWWPDDCKVDGQYLICRVPPRHEWTIDGRANNCDSPCAVCRVPYKDHKGKDHNYTDSRPTHRCWVRHGVAPDLTIDKAGDTCGAGAGSIGAPQWHGFLRTGYLMRC